MSTHKGEEGSRAARIIGHDGWEWTSMEQGLGLTDEKSCAKPRPSLMCDDQVTSHFKTKELLPAKPVSCTSDVPPCSV